MDIAKLEEVLQLVVKYAVAVAQYVVGHEAAFAEVTAAIVSLVGGHLPAAIGALIQALNGFGVQVAS